MTTTRLPRSAFALQEPGCGCEAPGDLVSIDQALDIVLQLTQPLDRTTWLPLRDAYGRVLVETVTARKPVPPFANSAMDGFAVRLADCAGHGPFELPIQGRIAAGSPSAVSLKEGHACTIFTGAPLPEGADAVLPVETVTTDGQKVVIPAKPRMHQHVRLTGDDVGFGEETLATGRRLDSRALGLTAASGCSKVLVRDKPRVALLLTGNEVITPGESLPHGGIWDVNGPVLATAIEENGAVLVSEDHVKDDRFSLARKLHELGTDVDFILTTGGVSVGEEDHVIDAVMAAGGTIHVAGIAMKPGKPTAAGRIGNALWLGLPGNPLSAFVSWTLFGRPCLAKLLGQKSSATNREIAAATNTTTHKPGRCELRPASFEGFDAQGRRLVHLDPATHSARVRALADADALAFVPLESEGLNAGDLVEVILLNTNM